MSLIADPGAVDFPRDQWGHPLIDVDGKLVPYVRASSAAKTVEDTYNLEMWARRNVVFGMARDSSLVARVLAIGGDPSTWDLPTRKQVNKIHEDAAAVALAHRRADIGTAVHRLTERVDRGEDVVAGPYEPDLEAYVNTLIGVGLTVTHVECRIVCDTLQMAGTADRIVVDRDGHHRILDLKTGESVDYGGLGWAAQLAAYAHGSLYDVDTGTRLDTPLLDRTVGYICHLPAGQGRCDLYEIDLVAGYRAATLANEIRAVRREARRWIAPLAPQGEQAVSGVAARAPDTATVDESKSRHPSNVERREALRGRYRALGMSAQAQFRRRQIDPADLDAVEGALEELERPPLAVVHAELGHGHDEGVDAWYQPWDQLEARYLGLPEPVRHFFLATVAEANRAGVPFHGHHSRTDRRWHLNRGVLAICAEFDDATDDLADVMRGMAHYIQGDAALFPTVTLGHAVGAMSAADAERFAVACEAYVAGGLKAYVTGPALRLVPV